MTASEERCEGGYEDNEHQKSHENDKWWKQVNKCALAMLTAVMIQISSPESLERGSREALLNLVESMMCQDRVFCNCEAHEPTLLGSFG